MTVFESRMTGNVRLMGDSTRTPIRSGGQVGWVAAIVWPAVWTAVVAGSLLGAEGRLLFWAGIVGVVAMLARQGAKHLARTVRHANFVIDNAPSVLDAVPATVRREAA